MLKIFRALLMVGMLITTYLLVIAWRDDNARAPVAVAPTPIAGLSATGVPLPAAALPTPTVSVSSADVVSVHTPRYDIKIDLNGGDVVYAALINHSAALDSREPFVLLENQARTYVAQTGILGVGGAKFDTDTARTKYHAAKRNYTWADAQNGILSVPLRVQENGVYITKTYQFSADYPIKLSTNIINQGQDAWTGQIFAQLKRDNSKDPSLADKGMMGLATYLGGAWGTPSSPYQKFKFGNFAKDPLVGGQKDGWVGIIQHYFVSAWSPSYTPNFYTRKINADGEQNIIGYTSPTIRVDAGKQITLTDTLYAGPKIQSQMAKVATGLEQSVDYGFLWPISKFLFALLENIHKVVGNWGWSIIILTLVVKTALLWFSTKSYASMAKMRIIAPKLAALKEKYGDDRMAMSQAMMQIYKDEKVNPMAGCLPIFLQMPIFLALYWVLVESIELRHAPWILWIKDLSAMDPWFVLPIIMGATMFLQQMFSPQPTDPMQAKIMRYLPIVFALFMLFFPAGLVLYWTVNNIFSMAHQHIVNRHVDKQAARA